MNQVPLNGSKLATIVLKYKAYEREPLISVRKILKEAKVFGVRDRFKIKNIADSTSIVLRGPGGHTPQRSLFSILKSPFKYKRHMHQFDLLTRCEDYHVEIYGEKNSSNDIKNILDHLLGSTRDIKYLDVGWTVREHDYETEKEDLRNFLLDAY